MSARATEDSVGSIIDVDPDIDLTPFIAAANGLVNACCLNSDYTDDWLADIETWLAAHFYAVRDPQVIMSTAGSIQQQYESKVGYGLMITRYGQQAVTLDYAGNLAALDNSLRTVKEVLPAKKGAGITWLGTDCS